MLLLPLVMFAQPQLIVLAKRARCCQKKWLELRNRSKRHYGADLVIQPTDSSKTVDRTGCNWSEVDCLAPVDVRFCAITLGLARSEASAWRSLTSESLERFGRIRYRSSGAETVANIHKRLPITPLHLFPY